MNEEKVKKVENILSESDIVWSKYGTETIEDLAKKIVEKLEDQ